MSADVSKNDLDTIFIGGLADEGLTFAGTTDLDDSDVTWAVTAGWKFIPYMAVEGQYLDLGEATYTATGDVTDVQAITYAADVGMSIDSSGFALSVLGIVPIAEVWEIYARVGMYFGDTEADMSVTVDDVTESFSDSSSEEEFFYGLGAGYTLNETWNFRIEYSVFQDIGDEDLTGEADLDRFVFAVNYMF
jgi:OOP family OmpA-OmpF porin